jgi:hypothetical protein
MPLTISHAKSNTIGDFTGTVTVYNSSGGTMTVVATNILRPSDWNSVHNYTFTPAASEMASLFAMGYYEPFALYASSSHGVQVGSWFFDPVFLPNGLNKGRINLFVARDSSIFLNAVVAQSNSLGVFSITGSFRNCIAIYSQKTDSSNSILSSLWTAECAWSATRSCSWSGNTSGMSVSNYLTIGFNSQFNSTGGVTSTTQTGSGTFSTGATSMASTAPNSLITVPQNWFTGSGIDIIPISTTLAPGNYWIAHMFTTHTGGAGTTGANFTSVGHTLFNGTLTRLAGADIQLSVYKRQGFATSANSTSPGSIFHGQLLTTTSNASASVGSINLSNWTRRMYWQYVQDTL